MACYRSVCCQCIQNSGTGTLLGILVYIITHIIIVNATTPRHCCNDSCKRTSIICTRCLINTITARRSTCSLCVNVTQNIGWWRSLNSCHSYHSYSTRIHSKIIVLACNIKAMIFFTILTFYYKITTLIC